MGFASPRSLLSYRDQRLTSNTLIKYARRILLNQRKPKYSHFFQNLVASLAQRAEGES